MLMRIFPQLTHLQFLAITTCMALFLGLSQGFAQAANENQSSITLSCKPQEMWFGGVPVGQSKTINLTLVNSGSTAKTISAMTRNGTAFSAVGLTLPLTLNAGQSSQFAVKFSPTVAEHVDQQFQFSVASSSTKLNLALHGTGQGLHGFITASPSSLSFGSVPLKSSASLTLTITNPTKASVSVSQATVAGSNFTASGLDLPLTLTPGQSFTFTSIFTPTVSGTINGSISIAANSSHLVVPLSGVGTSGGATVSISPATLAFGTVTNGNTKQLTGSLTASGGPVTVSSASLSSGEFALSGITFPFTIATGKSVSYTVTFDPQSSGSVSGSLSFVSNATDSTVKEALTGAGQSGASYSVDLSWNASSGSISGYNIYRGTKSGGAYSRINSTLNASTSYVDSSVAASTTYYYVTTAVGTDGVESKYSNQVQAVVP
jgi:ASPM-SPD-2-Hydin domain-containing protein/centrosomal CEP192-like protein